MSVACRPSRIENQDQSYRSMFRVVGMQGAAWGGVVRVPRGGMSAGGEKRNGVVGRCRVVPCVGPRPLNARPEGVEAPVARAAEGGAYAQ